MIIIIIVSVLILILKTNLVWSISGPTQVEVENTHVYVTFTPYLDYSERTELAYANVIISNS
jgi:hypothetical protein